VDVPNELSPGPDRVRSKDVDLARSLLLGCAIVFVLFVLGSALIGWLWLRGAP
jgi:hypothetical protein